MSTKKLQQSHLQQSVKKFSIPLQQKNQTQKKLKNLFYVKSKHTKKYFDNHPYFRTSTQINERNRSIQKHDEEQRQQQKIPIINQKRLKTQSIIEPNKKISKRHHTQFVSLPTQYGLENTYNYIKQRSFLCDRNVIQSRHKLKSDRYCSPFERSKKMSLKYSNNNNNLEGDQNGKWKGYMRATESYESRVFNNIEGWRRKGLSLGIDEAKNISTNYLQNFSPQNVQLNISKRKNSLSLTNQPQLHQSKFTQDQKSLIYSNAFYNTSMPKHPPINLNNLPAKHQTKFLFGKRLGSVHEIPHRLITFDLFPPIIATFLKCKILYKDMNQAQYNFISTQIKRVLKENKKPEKYDIKDIVNISTIKQLIKFLQQFSQEDYQMTQIIRYFFLFNEEKALRYHLQKVKDQVANFIAIKFDAEFGKKDLFLFDLQTKKEVKHFYDLLQGQRFIIGDDPNVMMDYIALNNKRAENQQMESKIKKWKSIADCETLSSVKNSRFQNPTEPLKLSKNSSENQINPSIKRLKLTDEKFNLIFDQFKIRQQKRMSKHINLADSKIVIHKSRDIFVERSRLKKEQDFFE